LPDAREVEVFTGVVETIGRVQSLSRAGESATIAVNAGQLAAGCADGDSVSINGVCLTVVSVDGELLRFDIGQETLARSTLGDSRSGDVVNLERAMPADGRFGGHFVQGHIDGKGLVRSVERRNGQSTVRVSAPGELSDQIVVKGSVALDGVSLTVAAKQGSDFSVALVPFTLEHTTLGAWETGRRVNVETDLIVKCVFAYLDARGGRRGETGAITAQFLRERGFA